MTSRANRFSIRSILGIAAALACCSCSGPSQQPEAAAEPASASARDEVEPLPGVPPEQVFRRAFWRNPSADDRIVHSERYETRDADGRVSEWRWFLAVSPSPELRSWLFNENPFSLIPVPAADLPANAPEWFPKAEALDRMSAMKSLEGHMQVFIDDNAGILYAADSGVGFAPAAR
jgi:hypothetical protein